MNDAEQVYQITPDFLLEAKPLYQQYSKKQQRMTEHGFSKTGKAKQFSNLDLVIITQQSLSLSEYAILKEAFAESDLPFKVDRVDWTAASVAFREITKANKVIVQSAQEK